MSPTVEALCSHDALLPGKQPELYTTWTTKKDLGMDQSEGKLQSAGMLICPLLFWLICPLSDVTCEDPQHMNPEF